MTATGGYRAAHATLAAAQKPGHGVPFYMRVVNRRIGRVLAAGLAQTRTTPDHVTALSALSALLGLALLVLAPPTPVVAVGVVLLLQLAFALDSADGQLARLTGRGSGAGEWTDHVVDAGRTILFHLAIAVALVRHELAPVAWALLPLGFAVVASVRFFAQILAEQLRPAGSAEPPRPGGPGGRAALLQLPADTGVVNASLLLWPWTTTFLLGYGLLAAATTVLLGATLVRRRRELLKAAT
ncbi:MAG: CDP-alcohol phosphatidyltransferase family protein [Aeromicrobium erythreum]